MKKLLSLILAFTLVMSMGITAFAAEDEDKSGVGAGSYNAEVTGNYVAGSGDIVYSVDIQWSGLSFTYDAGGKEWNPSIHDYNITEGTGWAESNAQITVTNHSNVPIIAEPTWNAASGYSDAMMTFYTNNEEVSKLAIASAEPEEGKENGEAQIGTFTVKPSGSLPSDTGENVKIGTITVVIRDGRSTTYDSSTNTYTVYNGEGLASAISAGANVVLGCDMSYAGQLKLANGADIVLDLNGYTLTMTYIAYPIWINSGASLTVQSADGGTIETPQAGYSFYVGGSLTVTSGTIGTNINSNSGTTTITGGTFGFDPTTYVDTDNYTVTNNGDGTYTVTAKAE